MAKFIHFTGIVEDRQDPHKAGRVRVRCLGFHSENKTALPTADLPWAQPLLPTTASGISGLGTSPTFLVNGTWVFGFFRDGETMQQPVVLGTLPGKPTEYSSRWYDKAFYDGQGIYPKYIGESDMNRLATNEIGWKDGLPYAKHPHLSLDKSLSEFFFSTGIGVSNANKANHEFFELNIFLKFLLCHFLVII